MFEFKVNDTPAPDCKKCNNRMLPVYDKDGIKIESWICHNKCD